MAGRGRTTFQKRQKEQMRLERRQQKAARKIERKAVKDETPGDDGIELLPPTLDAEGNVIESVAGLSGVEVPAPTSETKEQAPESAARLPGIEPDAV
jgi:hypothetical protein